VRKRERKNTVLGGGGSIDSTEGRMTSLKNLVLFCLLFIMYLPTSEIKKYIKEENSCGRIYILFTHPCSTHTTSPKKRRRLNLQSPAALAQFFARILEGNTGFTAQNI
jgi:hypothetical protein